MPGLFAAAGAMLVSLNRDEVLGMTIPSKLQSYFAAGRPVLGSLDGEGARVIHDSGAGLASPAEDASQLASNVRRMASCVAEQRAHMGRAGRRYYDVNFSRGACLDRLEAALSGVCNRHGAAASREVA